ncbi:serine/threonine protein kinase [Embleya sp. NPDC050493]|uniref:serine/threonine protein kinase n=1 Tax=Embleya sp. NPDC050493 TaxID=3363989 RepID=UPI003790B095
MNAGEVLGGRYRLEVVHETGGVATLYAAYDLRENRKVAVKMLRPIKELIGHWIDPDHPHTGATQLRNRFRREGKLLSELDFPGIPEFYDQGEHQGSPYLVMRFVEGISLRSLLNRRRPLPLAAAVSIAVGVGEALDCAHTIPVVHRDVKPENIIIGPDGWVFLVDFGIALPLRPGATRYTTHGTTPGSLGYMAPEQILNGLITPRTDWYGFGCLLYELLSGDKPFVHVRGGLDIVREYLTAEPRSLPAVVPVELATLTRHLLAKDPSNRPETADPVLAVLRRFLPKEGAPAPNPGLDPDPTLRHREPNRRFEAAARPRAAAGGRAPAAHRRSTWLSRRQVEAIVIAAEEELRAENPGPNTHLAAEVLPDARRDWGLREPVVARAQLIAADGSLIEGDHRRAPDWYGELIAEFRRDSSPFGRDIALRARVGVADCLLTFGEVAESFERWTHIVHEAAALPQQTSVELRRRVHGLGHHFRELRDLGYESKVDELLTLLPLDDDDKTFGNANPTE